MPTDESVILVPLPPFDQFMLPPQPLAVKVKVFGEQTTFCIGAVIVGVDGRARISKPVTKTLALETQLLTVQVADMA